MWKIWFGLGDSIFDIQPITYVQYVKFCLAMLSKRQTRMDELNFELFEKLIQSNLMDDSNE